MAYETLLVAFDTAEGATEAVQAIRRMGVPAADIRRHPASADSIEDVAALPEEAETRLAFYKKALDEGGTVISVRVLEEEAEQIRAALDRFGPLDVAVTDAPPS